MSMFCFQCQETLRNEGCTQHGMCGKSSACSNLMDVLIYALRGLSLAVEISDAPISEKTSQHIVYALFTTLTNTCFDELKIERLIRKTLDLRDEIIHEHEEKFVEHADDILLWNARSRKEFLAKAPQASPLVIRNPDVRSLREFLTLGIKGAGAYVWHALRLGGEDEEIHRFIIRGLAETAPMDKYDSGALLAMIKECGNIALRAMEILNEAHVRHFGSPRRTVVSAQTGKRPGILVSGHDLKDLEDLLIQAAGQGIDIYTHGEMLPAHAYPNLNKYRCLVANYGGSWWRQNDEFDSFNGPILVTSNCLAPIRNSCKPRIFTTGPAGWPGIRHIGEPEPGKLKDFSEIIRLAKKLPPPEPLTAPDQEEAPKTLVVGYGFDQLLKLADQAVAGIQSGDIENIVVIAGCDGRQVSRRYYEELDRNLSEKTLVLTAGCQKYRLNQLEHGKIGDIPRLLDAGQCNDAWAIVMFLIDVARKMKLDSVNELPLRIYLAWYEQKSVAVLLALLAAGVKNVTLGPTIPAFFSENILRYLKENYGLEKFQGKEECWKKSKTNADVTVSLEELLI